MLFDEKGMTARGRTASPPSVLILEENGKIVTNLVLSCQSGLALLKTYSCVFVHLYTNTFKCINANVHIYRARISTISSDMG